VQPERNSLKDMMQKTVTVWTYL